MGAQLTAPGGPFALHLPVQLAAEGLQVGDQQVPLDNMVDCGPGVGAVPASALAEAAARHAALSEGACRPQLAALAFAATGRPRALDHYFPLARALPPAEQAAFDALVAEAAHHPNLDLRLFVAGGGDAPGGLPPETRHLVAGHLAEVFFYRRDLLAGFLAAPRHIHLYATRQAFEQAGGQAGGCYQVEAETLQFMLARLYEGFNAPTPGVAPFLHELGHMLDFCDVGSGRMKRHSQGLLPGLSPADGPAFTPRARGLFLQGKRLELERYQARVRGETPITLDALPLGHPYVFQNDTEFCAGYFEMFLRNPHTFAAQNPTLFAGYVALFGYDPRRCWAEDFPYYVEANRRYYLSGERPSEARVRRC